MGLEIVIVVLMIPKKAGRGKAKRGGGKACHVLRIRWKLEARIESEGLLEYYLG